MLMLKARMGGSRCFAAWGALVVAGVLLAPSASAGETDRARERATKAVDEVEQAASSLGRSVAANIKHDPTELIAAADLHLRTNQPEPAIDALSKVVELHREVYGYWFFYG